MPRVPSVNVPRVTTPDVSPGYAPDPRGAFTAEAFGAGVGRAMAGMGQAIAGLGAAFVERQERVDAIDASNKLIEFNEGFNEWQANTEREWDEKGTGYANAVTDEFNTRAGEFIQQVPETLRPEFNNRLLRLRGHYADSALSTQFKKQDDFSRKSLTNEASRAAGIVETDPSRLENEKAGIEEKVELSTLPRAEREAHKVTARKMLEGRALRSTIKNSEQFRSRLKFQESSGRPNLVNQLGYAGYYQFGAPRLAHMGVYRPGAGESLKGWSKTGKNAPGKWTGTFNIPGHPEVKTIRDFLRSPAAQETAYDIHERKMDQEIVSRGLDKFEGQTIAGVKITRSGLYGMLHLGGAGGAEAWLESGGRRGARDANRTSVGDYARKFANLDTAVPAGAVVERPTITDLDKRPAVALPSGERGTVKSFSFNDGGTEVLVPQIVNGQLVSEEAAIKHYRDTGEHLGKYKTPEDATAASKFISDEQGQRADFAGAGDDDLAMELEPVDIPAEKFTEAAKIGEAPDENAWMDNPRFASLTYDEKIKIRDDAKAIAKKEETERKQQQNQVVNEAFNSLMNNILDGNAGAKEIADAEASWLTDFDKRLRARALLEKREKETLDLRSALLDLERKDYPWSQFDSNDEKKLNLIHEAEDGKTKLTSRDLGYAGRLMNIAEATKMAPKGAVEFMRGAIVSGDGKKIDYALSLALGMMAHNPNIFSSHEGGEFVESQAAKYAYFLKLNYSATEASERIAEAQTPEYKAKVESLLKGKDLDKIVAENIKPGDVKKAFTEWYEFPRIGIGGVAGGFTPEIEQEVARDYAFLTREIFKTNGDIDEAKDLAITQLKQSWGVTEINGAKTVMRYPHENAAAYAGIDPTEVPALIAEDVIETVKKMTGKDIAREAVRILPVPHMFQGSPSTREMYRTGQAPYYTVQWQDPATGKWETMPRPARFEPQELRDRLTAKREAALEKARLEGPSRFALPRARRQGESFLDYLNEGNKAKKPPSKGPDIPDINELLGGTP